MAQTSLQNPTILIREVFIGNLRAKETNVPKSSKDRIRTATSRSHRSHMETARADAFAEDYEVSKSDLQQVIEREPVEPPSGRWQTST